MSLITWIVVGNVLTGIALLELFWIMDQQHRRLKHLEWCERKRSEIEARSVPRPRVP